MSALVVLISASLILAIGFLIAFILATKKGQYEDVYTPSVRILFDDEIKRQESSEKNQLNDDELFSNNKKKSLDSF